MSSGNKQLVELIAQGIEGRHHNAEHRPPWPPRPSALFDGKTVKKKREDSIFNQVG
jgi:hypothetical protein